MKNKLKIRFTQNNPLFMKQKDGTKCRVIIHIKMIKKKFRPTLFKKDGTKRKVERKDGRISLPIVTVNTRIQKCF